MWHVLLLGYLLLLLDINRGKEGIKYTKYNHDLGKNTSCKNMKTQEKNRSGKRNDKGASNYYFIFGFTKEAS